MAGAEHTPFPTKQLVSLPSQYILELEMGQTGFSCRHSQANCVLRMNFYRIIHDCICMIKPVECKTMSAHKAQISTCQSTVIRVETTKPCL